MCRICSFGRRIRRNVLYIVFLINFVKSHSHILENTWYVINEVLQRDTCTAPDTATDTCPSKSSGSESGMQ